MQRKRCQSTNRRSLQGSTQKLFATAKSLCGQQTLVVSRTFPTRPLNTEATSRLGKETRWVGDTTTTWAEVVSGTAFESNSVAKARDVGMAAVLATGFTQAWGMQQELCERRRRWRQHVLYSIGLKPREKDWLTGRNPERRCWQQWKVYEDDNTNAELQ